MRCSPRLLPVRGHRKSLREKVKLLKNVVYRDVPLVARADLFPELGFDIAADNEDDALETRAQSVEHRVIKKSFARWSHRVDLL